MRKNPLFIIGVILIAVLTSVLAFACTKTDAVDPDTVVDLEIISEAFPEYVKGESLNINDIKLKATYADGSTYEFGLDNSMLSEEDRGKFFTAGVHSVTINYGGKQIVMQLKVVDSAQAQYYTAEFYSNGGSDVDSQYTDVIRSITTPSRDGYTFKGWYASSSFEGSRLVTPYELKENTKFYALWEDNRRCTVKFLDGDEVVDSLTVVYGTGIDITDLIRFPAPAEKEGKRFSGWSSKSGSSLTEIVTDVEVVANYESINCTVTITYLDDVSKTEVTRPRTLRYGEYFDVSEYTMPTKEGHTSRWVYRKSSDAASEAVTFPTDERYRVVEDIVVTAEHTINTYAITIYNGSASQSNSNLKNNDIQLVRVYNINGAGNEDYTVKYGEDFNIKDFVSESLNLTEPATVSVGYDGEWCFVLQNERGETILKNASNMIWSDDEGAFVLAKKSDGSYEEEMSEFDLTDRDGNYIAHVSQGNLKNIKGNVTIRAKYYKKEYNVILYRRQNDSNWVEVDSFTEEFLADFDLYDPAKYVRDKDEGKNFQTKQDVENYYRLHNVADWSKAGADTTVYDLWSTVYKNGNRPDQNYDDWGVEWYTNSSLNESVRVDFTTDTYEVYGEVRLYCNDVDLRRYDVTLYYDYDFDAPSGAENYGYRAVNSGNLEIKEKETLQEPSDARNPIIRTYVDNGTMSNVTYVFDGWYDYPYEHDGKEGSNGFKGNAYSSLDVRTRSMVYYAHYRCNVTYTLTVHDKTQRDAFKKTPPESPYNGQGYDVEDNTVVYEVTAGSVVTSDMLYKGLINPNGTITSGQYFYGRWAYAYEYLGDGDKNNPQGVKAMEYNAIVAKYGNGDKNNAISALNALISELNGEIKAYENMLGYMYSYDYVNLTEESFLESYLTVGQYNEKRSKLQGLQNELSAVENFDDCVLTADEYRTESANYHRYIDSEADLNAAYGKTDGEIKYRFSGWYTNSEYSSSFTANRSMQFSWLAVGKNLDLYAKWADEEKGSEGLVFKKVTDGDGNILGLVVVDFMNKADYDASAYAGCGYNDFNNFDYSVNFNDQDEMPVNLGSNLDIQIPAAHGGEGLVGYPVIGVLRDAFKLNGKDVLSITLPKDIKFIEEGAFYGCNLSTISGGGDYVETIDERIVYQVRDYEINEYKVEGDTLIVYAGRFAGSEAADKSNVVVKDGTTRIADYAFYNATYLNTVKFAESLTSIGDSAFEHSALSGSETAGTLILPSGFESMGSYAFRECVGIEFIEHGTSIGRVGKDALSTTKWFTKQTGVITLNGLVIGIRGAVESDFDKEEDGQKTETELENGMTVNSYTNAYGVLYYSADTHKLIAVRVTDADGIAEYAFGIDKNDGSIENFKGDVAAIYIDADITKYGIAERAFLNCVNLTDLYLDLSCEVASDVFDGCGRVTVHNEGSGKDASWDNFGEKVEFA